MHWQLRSLISTDGSNTVYFPTGPGNLQIQRLDTTTCATETIKVLPFLPRCLVAKKGYICAGGEHGEFAAIHIEDLATLADKVAAEAVDPGTSPDAASNPRVRQTIESFVSDPRRKVGHSKKFGKDRVNCVTLWWAPDDGIRHQHAYDQSCAVLANNDKSVSVIGLAYQEVLDEICYPDCVNRAVISPDGLLLAAVSDDPYLYVHERYQKPGAGEYGCSGYLWRLRNKIHLIGQSLNDASDNRGSFAVCFSSSGRYLAVGTQYGAISIFDATALADPGVDSLLTWFTSSRPGLPLGAVRAMEFAPGPMDLLAWTEDRGRVGVADVRNGCVSRQIIRLEDEDRYDHLSLTDKAVIDPRLLESPRDATASSFTDALDAQPQARELINSLNPPLSRDETIVLEALQEQSRRQAQRAGERVSTATQRLLGATDMEAPEGDSERANHLLRRMLSPEGILFHSLPAHIPVTTLRERERALAQMERLREARNQGETRAEPRHEDRLRELTALIRANATESANSSSERRQFPTAGPAAMPPAPTRSSPSDTNAASNLQSEIAAHIAARRSVTARLMRNHNVAEERPRGPTHAWSHLERLYTLPLEHGVPAPEGLRSAVESDARRRDRAAFLIREWDTNPGSRRIGAYLRRDSLGDPFDTAGLAWSDDGRKLYVECLSHFWVCCDQALTFLTDSWVPRMVFTSSMLMS